MMSFCIANKALLAHQSDTHVLDIEPRQSAEPLVFQAERLGSGVGGGVRQPAQVLAHLHADVAFLAPRRAPRVANNPVHAHIVTKMHQVKHASAYCAVESKPTTATPGDCELRGGM